ncbi:MAG: hypothetical protein CMD01_01855 [Flavobacteriales bacterium]|nr:hypothetical protein [Flavobacteriales bacterium]
MFLNDFFQFTSSQRRGVVVLLIVLGVLGVFYLINSNSVSKFDVIIHPFVKEKSDSIQSSKDTSHFEDNKLFYFNPNLIYKDEWVRLGFSTKQVETILKYKEKIGGFKSKLDVKNCYVVSDQMYRLLSPYILIIDKDSKIQKLCNAIFLFQSDTPVYKYNKEFANLSFIKKEGVFQYYIEKGSSDSIIKAKFSTLDSIVFPKAEILSLNCNEFNVIINSNAKELSFSPIELNSASQLDFQKISGIGPVLSKRIINYKNNLGGFVRLNQLDEVYGLEKSILKQLKENFYICDSFFVDKLNVNLISIDSLKKHPYINWNLANAIVSYRNQHGAYDSIVKIKSTHLVNDEIYRKIAPYLTTR